MPTRDEITDAIKQATGNPDTGAIHEWTPVIAKAIDQLINGDHEPAKTVRKKDGTETRLMGGVENTRGESA